MAILRLPDSTVRRLGATVAVTNSLSLVKELVENSIDAGATLVEVTISSNTIDKIQVRDNGHGIAFEDHQFLGCRGHTSKLRDFGELSLKGGETFGFRGEALSGATTLATIAVTTRTVRDPIATRLILNHRTGGVKESRAVSAPVGTTVVSSKLFEGIAVRKQLVLKQSQKTLANIKKLLETYALALPHIRLSLEITGCSPKWTYSPGPSSTTQEAIRQVFKGSLSKQCFEASWPIQNKGQHTSKQTQQFVLKAFFPDHRNDAGEIKGKGAFISVDSRPILSSRGMGKKIYDLFKKAFVKARSASKTTSTVPSPFMQLSIICEPNSYDPNISASKDELLFANEQDVISAFQELCDTAYALNKGSKGERSGRNRFSDVTRIAPLQPRNARSEKKTKSEHGSVIPKPLEQPTTAEGQLDVPLDLDVLDCIEVLQPTPKTQSNLTATIQLSPPGPSVSRSTASIRPDILGKARDGICKEPVMVQMRTRARVNMARNESNASDNYDAKLESVQIPPRRLPVSDTAQPKRYSDALHNSPSKTRRSRGINDYFQRTRDEPIIIAEDETATPEPQGGHISIFSSPPRRRRESRYPLVELSEDLMNTRYQEEDDNDEYDASMDMLVPGDLDLATPDTLRLERVRAVDASVPEQIILRTRPVSTPHRQRVFNPTNSPLQTVMSLQMTQVSDVSPQQNEPDALQTPPPSNPIRTGQHLARQTFRPPRLSDTMVRDQAPSQRTLPLRNSVLRDGARLARLSWGGDHPEQRSRRQAHQTRGRAMSFQPRRNSGVLSHDGLDEFAKSERDGEKAWGEPQEG